MQMPQERVTTTTPSLLPPSPTVTKPASISPSLTQAKSPTSTTTNNAVANTLPRDGSSSIGITTADETRSTTYTPAGTMYKITKKDTGQMATIKPPEFLFKNIPAGTYNVTVIPGGSYTVSSYAITTAKNGNFTNSGFIQGSVATVSVEEANGVDVSFRLKNTGTTVANPNDKQHPWVTSINGPTELYGSGGNATVSQKDFCVTVTATDDFTPADKIAYQVTLIIPGSNQGNIYFSDWSTKKTHCFINLANNTYQLEFLARDESGNIAGFPASFKVLSS